MSPDMVPPRFGYFSRNWNTFWSPALEWMVAFPREVAVRCFEPQEIEMNGIIYLVGLVVVVLFVLSLLGLR